MSKTVQVIGNKIESINGSLVQVTVDGVPQEILNIEVSDELYESIAEDMASYSIDNELEYIPKYVYLNGEIVEDPNYQQKIDEQEQQRIGKLFLTRGDVFRGLLQAKGVTRAQLRGKIDLMPEETQEQRVQKELAYIDFDEALNFYRGVPLVDTLSSALGITSEQMTKFFETGDWHKLIELQQDKEE